MASRQRGFDLPPKLLLHGGRLHTRAEWQEAFPEKTAMYNIDATIGALIQQTKPNDGTLKAIGKLGLKDKPTTYAFDIQGMADGKNMAYLAAGKTLYTVNLETGGATEVGTITGVDDDVRDIAILPAM